MTKKKSDNNNPADAAGIAKRRRTTDAVSTMGLILLAAGLCAPFATLDNQLLLNVFKWIFTAGALIYTIARIVNVNVPGDSARLRRLRRMEMWAGFAFCFAAGFWIYNAIRYEGFPFTMAVMRDTVAFTLAGAIIQIVASWMISARMKKEHTAPRK